MKLTTNRLRQMIKEAIHQISHENDLVAALANAYLSEFGATAIQHRLAEYEDYESQMDHMIKSLQDEFPKFRKPEGFFVVNKAAAALVKELGSQLRR